MRSNFQIIAMFNYYDLDEIIMENEKVPCKFNLTIPPSGIIKNFFNQIIKKNNIFNLPLWLAEILASCELLEGSSESFVDLVDPQFLDHKSINAFKTSAVSVDLQKISPNYFKLVEKWCSLFENPEIVDVVMKLFKERALLINNFSNSINHSNNTFLHTLDGFEKNMYRLVLESSFQIKQWLESK